MMISTRRLLLSGALASLMLSACSKELVVEVELLEPCNQMPVRSVDFLRFEPRGEGVDSEGLTTIQKVSDGATAPVKIPLAEDFHMVVTGHIGSFDSRVEAIGVSQRVNLSVADEYVKLRIPFATVDSFYKTTSLVSTPTSECSALRVARLGAGCR